jgi:4-aminobutyrate--pyruvate transaminase
MWGSETFGIRPDIVTAAKGLSAAYLPISTVLVSERIYSALAEESGKIGIFGHGHTYSGHPVCAAVALEVLKIYEERDILGHVREVSIGFNAGLRTLGASPIVGEVRGIGLMAAIELVADKATKEPFPSALKLGAYLAARAQEHGLFVRAIGDAVVMAPPLIITRDEVDDLLRRLGMALAETEQATLQHTA